LLGGRVAVGTDVLVIRMRVAEGTGVGKATPGVLVGLGGLVGGSGRVAEAVAVAVGVLLGVSVGASGRSEAGQ
jgi:hypothetical protein